MSLKVEIQSIEAVRQRGEKYLKVRFRGTTFKTQTFAQTNLFVHLNESHKWTLSSPMRLNDTLTVQLVSNSRFLVDKVIDTDRISLEQLVQTGTQETETVLNDNKIKFRMSFIRSARFELPSIEETFVNIDGISDKRNLLDEEQQSYATLDLENDSLVEFSPTSTSSLNFHNFGQTSETSSTQPPKLRIIKIEDRNSENISSLGNNEEETSGEVLNDQNSIKTPVLVSKLKESLDLSTVCVKAQTISVCVKIIEGRQLVGLNINPIVCVEVGDKKKNTAVQQSTNAPYYNEYFVLTFREPPAKVFDKLITITCLHSKSLLQSNEVIGSFKLDVATVFQQPDHQFIEKWAPLSDSLSGEIKGYIKCDISVVANEDSNKSAAKRNIPVEITNDEDIESNLLLPEGVSGRALLKLTVKIFRADGLPKNDDSVGAALKKAFTAGSKAVLNPYVVVSFAGLKGKTSVCKRTCNPCWNEQISFIEMFPPLFQRIKIQVYDSSTGTDDIIATHYIPISKISNNSDDGFLPTFGPSYVNFYGAPRDTSDDDFEDLNNGLQEGVAYRGRVLLAISTEIIESVESEKERVTIKSIPPLDDENFGFEEKYMLFATIFDSNMISSKYSDKSLSYEFSIGDPDDIDGDGVVTDLDKKALKDYKGITTVFKPMKANTNYGKDNSYCLAITESKPSVFVKLKCTDEKRRLYNSNILSSIADNFELGLLDVETMCDSEHPDSERRLLGVIEQFVEECSKFRDAIENENDVSLEKKTKLDKERIRICKDTFDQITQNVDSMKLLVSKSPTEELVNTCYEILEQLRDIEHDIQSCIPDIIITLLVNGKRAAFAKLSARDYIYSTKAEERGKYCASIKTYFLYSPSKHSFKLRNKIDAYIWFGATKDKNHFAEGLVGGHKTDLSLDDKDPPVSLVYHEKHQLQFRAHIFQARSLIASDSSGLSDPYAKIYFLNSCLLTHVMEETLSPTWDELLVSPPITVFGNRLDLLNVDLNVVVEFYDKDTVGDDEYLGRAITKCSVRFDDQPYVVPQLDWIDIFRDGEPGGQLLASFELIQLSESDIATEYPRALPAPKSVKGNKSVLPIPPTIKPVLSKYRLGVIFWGLRDLKKVQMMSIDRPRVDVECGGRVISSTVISNYKKTQNFTKPVKFLDLELPDQEFYCPPILITVVDCRAFGRSTLVGTHTIKSVSKFISRSGKSLFGRAIVEDREIYIKSRVLEEFFTDSTPKQNEISKDDVIVTIDKEKVKEKQQEEEKDDWWTKYYASKMGGRRWEESASSSDQYDSPYQFPPSKLPPSQFCAIYSCELEKVAKYQSSLLRLHSFDLNRGKQKSNKGKQQLKVGKFKGSINLSKYPLPTMDPFALIPSNEPLRIFVRCYIVRAFDVKPKDIGGKADLYPIVKVGNQKVNDREKYIPNQLNPIFGRCYEFQATLPFESTLTVSLKDMDVIGGDDLIGSTKIDLEDRVYSFSRSTCGLQKTYETQGVNVWRNSAKPSQILLSMCRELKLPTPVVTNDFIKIGRVTFRRSLTEYVAENNNEQFCLDVLHNWKKAFGYKLVEEHIETRSLYSPERPGLCQGKLEMWVDIFAVDKPIPPAIDVTPRQPQQYELRVIIWNTEDVILDDENVVSGEKMSDIYVKGWLTEPKEAQSTDVHYRSLTGEGNFNWRFIFPFDYLPSEDKIVVHKKSSLFSMDTTEIKIPPNFNLQIWDADNFSGDDFLGAIAFDLNNIPRGAKTAKTCSLDMLKEESKTPKQSLFKLRRLRGWWPAFAMNEIGEEILAGKIDAEFQLLTSEEAEKSPAGLGRKEPDPLDPPNRPETSFLWFASPFKTFKLIIWSKYKWKFFKLLLLLLLIYFILMFIYSVPGYTVARVLKA